jgi:aminoglycoside 3-N-acetyltransferase
MKQQISGEICSVQSMTDDLHRLGLQAGMHVIVHTSYKSLGHVIGGPSAVILALENILTQEGTLLMPTFTEHLCDPSTEENEYPREYWEQVRNNLPVFQPDLTPTTKSIGIVPELFRKQNGVVRSSHPHLSFAAWGKFARELVCNHSFHYALGEGSPLARLYELEGYILLLGAPLDSNTSLHLAEYRVPDSMKKPRRWDVCMLINGTRTWTYYEDIENDCGDFPNILMDYMKEDCLFREGKVGNAQCFLIPQPQLVDYGVEWMMKNRQSRMLL